MSKPKSGLREPGIALLTAILLVVLLSGKGFTYFISNGHQELGRTVPADDLFRIVNSENLQDHPLVRSNDPSWKILWTQNGGDDWNETDDELRLEDVTMTDLTKIPTSIRFKPPHGYQPEIVSIIYKAYHPKKRLVTEEKVIHSIPDLNSDLPVIALTVSEDDFFSEDKGIMVPGKHSWNQRKFNEAWWYRPANYTQRGQGWSRTGHMQYIDEDSVLLSLPIDIRISGNATRGFSQKSMRIQPKKNGETDKFEFDFFDSFGLSKYESLVIRNSGNDNMRTMFADLVIHRISRKTNVIVQEGRPVLMFINGNFWGLYNLRERIDPYLIAKKEGTQKKKITILENGNAELKDGNVKEWQLFHDFISRLETEEHTADLLTEFNETIKVKSLIDYLLLEAFFANCDWPSNNSMFYKEEGKKWEWIINDLDYSMAYPGAHNLHNNLFNKLKTGSTFYSTLFNYILEEESLNEKLIERGDELLSEVLTTEHMTEVYSETVKQIQTEMPRQIRRWRTHYSVTEWEYYCEQNLNFLIERREVFKKQLEEIDGSGL